MTTQVIVKANHGWPVDVTPVINGEPAHFQTTRVAADTEQTFYAHSERDLLIQEVQPAALLAEKAAKGGAAPEHILQFFGYAHLPPHLQAVSKPFGDLADQIVATLPRNPERTVALRKLLEAKDAAVRALVAKEI